MAWEDVENAMWAAVVKASRLPPGQVVWSYQDFNQPGFDFISISFGGEVAIGVDRIQSSTDLSRPNGQEVKQEVKGLREVPFELQFFTSSTTGSSAANRLAALTATRMRLPDVRFGLRRVGLSPFDAGPVSWIPDIPSVNFRGRASMTIRCYVPVTDCVEYVGYIARVRGTWTAVGGGATAHASGYTGTFDSSLG